MALPEPVTSDLDTLNRIRQNVALQQGIIDSVQERLLAAIKNEALRNEVAALKWVLNGALRAYREGIDALISVEEALAE